MKLIKYFVISEIYVNNFVEEKSVRYASIIREVVDTLGKCE